jgi:hypothetical protein
MRKLTVEEFINKANKIHNNFYDYSQIEYISCHKKVEMVCPTHGPFFQTPGCHLNKRGCKKCGYEKLSNLYKSNKEEFIIKAIKIHGNKYDYSKIVYKNTDSKVVIICTKHREFRQTPHDHLDGHGCPKCNYRISKPEIEFLNYLSIPDTKENRQVKIGRKKVDGIKDNTIYEFLGNYYHGNPEIYKSEEYNPTCNKTFGELYNITLKKFDVFRENGYKIKYIWENDWKKYKSGNVNIPKIVDF